MAQKQFKIGLSNTDKQNMAQDVYERVLALTFNEYDTTTEYEVGDFVVYNDQLYKCIGATSGAWDSTKWQLATLNDLVTDIESAVAFVNDKANVNGNYPTMTVGFADNLTPYDESAGDDQDEPFSFQATGTGNGTQPDFSTGSGALMKEKQGNTVVVNQLVEDGNFATSFYWSVGYNCSSLSIANGVAEYVAAGSYAQISSRGNVNVVQGHKYLCSVEAKASRAIMVGCGTTSTSFSYTTVATDKYTNCIAIKEALSNATGVSCFVVASNSQANDVIYCKNVQYIDLTQWFGSNDNIPQDLLDNPSNFFRYYQGSLAYNTGTLVNANGRYIKCIGMNQWDEEWELGYWDTTTGNFTSRANGICSKRGHDIKVLPNTTYYIKDGVAGVILFYDINGNYLQQYVERNNGTFTTPKNCAFIRFYLATAYGTTYNNDISINLYYEDEPRCLTYEPYQVLTNNDTGTEVLRSAGSVKDSKAPDGTIHRLVGDYTFIGEETFSVQEADLRIYRFDMNSKGMATATHSRVLSSLYAEDLSHGIGVNMNDNSIITYNGYLYVRDTSCATASALVTKLSGSKINFELAEPTTEQGTPYSENLVIDDFGSMSWDSDVPQGNLIFYPVDYKAFVDTLYKYTDGTPSNIALKSDVASEQSARESVDTQLKNALGGTLRQCLCVKESLDFDNTDVIDLGTLNYAYDSDNHLFSVDISGMYINDSQTIPHIICTKYKTVESGYYSGYADKDKIVSTRINNAKIIIKDTTYTDGTIFKNAMKGVLLAYEKASE